MDCTLPGDAEQKQEHWQDGVFLGCLSPQGQDILLWMSGFGAEILGADGKVSDYREPWG